MGLWRKMLKFKTKVLEWALRSSIPNTQSKIKGREVEFLGGNQWLHVYRFKTGKYAGYTFSYEPKWADIGVGILPYRKKHDGQIEYLAVNEIRPVHGNNFNLYAITGGWDDRSISTKGCAVKEVKEETGYSVTESELFFLGTINNNKMSTGTMYLYAVDLTGAEKGSKVTDGSRVELDAYASWIDLDTLITDGDNLLAKMYLLLRHRMENGKY